MNEFLIALGNLFSLEGMIYLTAGVIAGIVVGALPGLTATMAIAVLLPFTFNIPMDLGILLLLGIYNGSMYGGSISAVLVGIPGTPAALVTTIDGHAMAKQGQAGKAIGLATIASFTGGFLSTIVLIVASPILGALAARFGSPEFFMLAVFGLVAIATASPHAVWKGIATGVLGILIAMIGRDEVTSIARYSYGLPQLEDGLEFVPMMIGLFGMSEVLSKFLSSDEGHAVTQKLSGLMPSWEELKRLGPSILKGSGIGIMVGAIPGEGASVAALLAYNDAKTSAGSAGKFGEGDPRGIVAPESANNAVTGGSLIPMLTLGIPGNASTAILMGAFMMQNIVPGPMLFKNNMDLIYTIFLGMAVANIVMLAAGLGGAKYFAKLLTVPTGVLMSAIAVFSAVGSYAVNNSIWDIGVMLVFGILGLALRRGGFPVPPMVLGLILGPMAEASLRRTILISRGDYSILFTRPISLIIFALTIFSVAWPYVQEYRKSRKAQAEQAA